MISLCSRRCSSQRGVGVFAQEDGMLGLALVPIEDDAVVICGHPRSPRIWYIVWCLLCPMMGSKEHSLEGWHIE